MKYRLGIDLGTSSIGVVAYKLNKDNEIEGIAHIDSYIFGEPIEPKDFSTKNSKRRDARLIRRQVQRKAKRLKKIAYIAQSIGISREQTFNVLGDKIHELRANAVSQKVELPELIKIFFHIVKNRGYKGNLKRNGNIKGNINEAKKLLEEKKCKTLGQLWWKLKQDSKQKNIPWKNISDTGTYIERKMVEDEFDLIWDKQEKEHEVLKGNYKIGYPKAFPEFEGKSEINLKEAFMSAMFYQRPIRWDLESVGDCPYEEDEKRASTAQMAFQDYRMAGDLANIRVINKVERGEGRVLSKDEHSLLFSLLNSWFDKYNEKNELPYNFIYKEMGINEDIEKFNIDRRMTRADGGIKGNATAKVFSKNKVLKQWEALNEKAQEITIEFLSCITDFGDIEDSSDEHVKNSINDLTENINDKQGGDMEKAFEFILLLKDKEVFSNEKFNLEQNRAEYSVKALKKITEQMKQGKERTQIIKELYPQSDEERNRLRAFKDVKTGSPIIDRVLREFKRTMDYIVHKLGDKPSEITIELSRDLKKSLKQRQFIENQNKENQKERNEAIKELLKFPISPTGKNIEKYLLWKEQRNLCPYCGQEINNGDAFNSKITEVDHIIPQTIGGPNIYSNKVLSHTDCNKNKGGNTPYLASKINNVNFEAVQRMAEDLKKEAGSIKKRPIGNKWIKPQKKKNLEQKIENLLIEKQLEEIEKNFSERQNQETAWISKIVLKWCCDICDKVNPTFGGLTAHLRNIWNFKNILPEIRIKEGKPIFNRENEKIDEERWEELFLKEGVSYKDTLFKQEFEKYADNFKEKPLTESDWQRAFWRFLDTVRKDYVFNKRCDHRHHAIDAAIIGLCDRSLVQKANSHNGKNGTLKDIVNKQTGAVLRLGFFPKNPFSNSNKELRKRLFNYTVWHKPDRYPNKEFFQENAYSAIKKGNKTRLVKRYSLDNFLKKNKLEDVVNKLEDVLVGEDIKKEIVKQLKDRLENKGMSLKDALIGKDENDGIFYKGNKVKKVKAMYKMKSLVEFKNDIDVALINKNKDGKERNKYYLNGGFACMDFDKKTGNRLQLIPIWKYQQEYKDKTIDENTIRVFAGDTVFNKTKKKFFTVSSFKERDGFGFLETTESKEISKKVYSNSFNDFLQVKDRKVLSELKNGK